MAKPLPSGSFSFEEKGGNKILKLDDAKLENAEINEDDGIFILVFDDGSRLEINFDTNPNCCENFNFTSSFEEYDFDSFEFKFECSRRNDAEENDYLVYLKHGKEWVEILNFYNHHNGYYSHSYDIAFVDEEGKEHEIDSGYL